MRRILATLLIVGVWTGAALSDSTYPDRPVHVRVTGTFLPFTQEPREDLITVKVFVQGQPWLLRLGKVEGLTELERERTVQQDILLRQVRFYGPDELIAPLRQPDIAGKVITIEGRLDAREKRFLVTAVEVAADGGPHTPQKK